MSCATRLTILAAAVGCARPDEAPRAGDDGPTLVDTDLPLPTPDSMILSSSAAIHPVIGSIVVVTWEQSTAATVHLEFAFEPGEWRQSPARFLPAGTHQELILGVPYGESVNWILFLDTGKDTELGPERKIANAPLPTPRLAGDVTQSDPSRYDAEGAPFWFVSISDETDFGARWWSLIVDRAGRVVWALQSPVDRIALHARVARDGRSLLLDRNSYWPLFDGGAGGTIDRITIDGTVQHTYAVPGLHHPFVDLPDRSIAWGSTVQGYLNEYLMIVHEDGTTETIFDCEAWLAEIGSSDFCMSNTLWYDEAANQFLFSQFSTETIVRIDRATGVPNAWWGHAAGSWAFDPPSSAFWWQHGGHLTDAGTLLSSTDVNALGVETVVREYTLDEANQTLHEIWNFGVGAGVYGYQLGEVERLPNGNTLHNYGELAELREATPEGDVVWQIDWSSYAIGRSMPLVDLYELAP